MGKMDEIKEGLLTNISHEELKTIEIQEAVDRLVEEIAKLDESERKIDQKIDHLKKNLDNIHFGIKLIKKGVVI